MIKLIGYFLVLSPMIMCDAFNKLIFHNKIKDDLERDVTVVFYEKKFWGKEEIVRQNVKAQDKYIVTLSPDVTKVQVDVYCPAIKEQKGEISLEGEKKSFSYIVEFEKGKDGQLKEIGVDDSSFKTRAERAASASGTPEKIERKEEKPKS